MKHTFNIQHYKLLCLKDKVPTKKILNYYCFQLISCMVRFFINF